MKVVSLDEAKKVPFALDGRVMFSGDRTEIVHLQLQPGEVLEPHTNPVDVIFYCLEGEAVLNVEGESLSIRRDHCLMVSSSYQRSWTNTGEGVLRVLVIKQKN